QNIKNGNLLEPLTEREIEILTLLSKGLKNREIGDKIFLASTTVKKHIYNIYQKLDVHSRIEVVTKARELELLL
ncbi:MAG: LuxR C-terminal-related transcriptional regulator, partial [Ignavibacteriaceae bacterium]